MNISNENDIFNLFKNKLKQLNNDTLSLFQYDNLTFNFLMLLCGSIIFELLGRNVVPIITKPKDSLSDFFDFFLSYDKLIDGGNMPIIRLVQLSFGALAIPSVRENLTYIVDNAISFAGNFYIENNFYINAAIALSFITLIYFNIDKIKTNDYIDIIKTAYEIISKPVKSIIALLDYLFGKLFYYFDFRLFLEDKNYTEMIKEYPNIDYTFQYINLRWSLLLGATTAFMFRNNITGTLVTFTSQRLYNIFMIGVLKIFTDLSNLIYIDYLKILPTWKFDVNSQLDAVRSSVFYDKEVVEARASSVFLSTLEFFGVGVKHQNAYMCWYDNTINYIYKIVASGVAYYDSAKNYISSFFSDYFLEEFKIFGSMLKFIGFWFIIVSLLRYYLSTEQDEIISALTPLSVHEKTVVANSYITRFFEMVYISIYNDTIDDIKKPYLEKLNIIFNLLEYENNKDLIYVSRATDIINSFYRNINNNDNLRSNYIDMLDNYLQLLDDRIPEIRKQIENFYEYSSDISNSIRLISLLRVNASKAEINKELENLILTRHPKNYVPLLNFSKLESDLINLIQRYRSKNLKRFKGEYMKEYAEYTHNNPNAKNEDEFLANKMSTDDNFRLKYSELYNYVNKKDIVDVLWVETSQKMKLLGFTNEEIDNIKATKKIPPKKLNEKFKQVARSIHPDKNQKRNTTREFIELTKARNDLRKLFP